MEIFAWLEQTALSLWVRESVWGFAIVLTFHSIAMGFLVGANVVVGLRLLGFARGLPIPRLRALFPLMWLSFGLVLASGLLLLLAYPAKGLTNPVFYLKFCFIALALLILRHLARRHFDPPDPLAPPGRQVRLLALGALLCWAGAVTAGRFLAYTYSVLIVS